MLNFISQSAPTLLQSLNEVISFKNEQKYNEIVKLMLIFIGFNLNLNYNRCPNKD